MSELNETQMIRTALLDYADRLPQAVQGAQVQRSAQEG
jgi:hypothetical protein